MVKASDFQKTLELEVIHAGSNSRLNIEDSDINRPGLQLAGFLDYFPHERPQVLGKVEMTYSTNWSRRSGMSGSSASCLTICRA